jgi:hypothetical protein
MKRRADIILVRYFGDEVATRGVFLVPKIMGAKKTEKNNVEIFYSLELPYLDNKENISCIKPGTYEYYVGYSLHHNRKVIWLRGVEGRTNIQIHPLNYTKDSIGCIGVGLTQGYHKDNGPAIWDSGKALDRLLMIVPEWGYIKIQEAWQ